MKGSIFLTLVLILFSVFLKAQKIEWQKTYGGTSADRASKIIPTKAGGYIMVGSTSSKDGDVTNSQGGLWVVKINNLGQIDWQKTYGGSNAINNISSIYQTNDSGYIIAGSIYSKISNRQEDYYILKIKNNGDYEWQNNYGGFGEDFATSIIQTLDSGYIVAGYTTSKDSDVTFNHGNEDYWILKLKNNGNIEWQKSYGGWGDDRASSIIQTFDGGYIVAGFTESANGDITYNHGGVNSGFDYWVVKLKINGIIEWQKTYGGSGDDEAFSIIQTKDKGYIVVGYTTSHDSDVTNNYGGYNYWIVKLKDSGDIEWQKAYGGTKHEIANSIIQTNDGSYLIAGNSYSNDGDVTNNHGIYDSINSDFHSDYWILKLKSDGTMLWQRCYGGSKDDKATSIILANDGGYIVTGNTLSNDSDITNNHGFADIWVVKIQDNNSGIENETQDSGILKLYPNPANQTLNLEFEQRVGDKGQITITDISGRTLKTYKVSENLMGFDISNFSKGMYFIHYQDNTRIWNGKFIKE